MLSEKKVISFVQSSPAREDVEENEKNKPKKNNAKKLNKIFLSIFLQ